MSRSAISRGELEHRRQERVGDAPRKLGMILVDDGDRGVVQLLREAVRPHGHGEGEGIDHQPQEHEIAQETAQLLDAEPIDVRRFAHGPGSS